MNSADQESIAFPLPLPVGWKIRRVKDLAKYINGYAFKPDDWDTVGKPILRIQNLTDPSSEFDRYPGTLPDDYLVHYGDILISWSASLNVFKWIGEDAWLNQHIFKTEVDKNVVTHEYFFWLASWFISVLAERAHGSTMQHLTRDAFGSFAVPLPPLDQQNVLAQYLSKVTNDLDELINAKQELVDSLIEKRQALITHAVTRGLDPDAPLRDSGVPWLGEIPAHWEVTYLRRLLQSMDYGISEAVGSEGAVAILRMGDIAEGRVNFNNVGFVDEVEPNLLLEPGDLLFNRTNSFAQVGKVGLFPENIGFPVSFASYLVRMRCLNSVWPAYINYVLNSPFAMAWAKSEALPSIGQVNLNPNRYSYLLLPVPPLTEQLEIAKFLDEHTQQIKDLESAAITTIELLQERRSALIAAAVTGQLEVPEQVCN